MQHSKRASIYVSDASIILAQRAPIVSPTSSQDALLSPSNETLDCADHYAILELDPQATTEHVKSAYRRLRVVYFQSDAKKYRALQAAFDTLMDPQARQAYDADYIARASELSSIGQVSEQSKHERKDSATYPDAAMAAVSEEEDSEEVRDLDPDWALKRYRHLHSTLSPSYHYSNLPIATMYSTGNANFPRCSRPVYVGHGGVVARST